MSSTQEQLNEILKRVDRLEVAIYGEPDDGGKSLAILPTMRRASAYMDAACAAWRAFLLAAPVAAGLVVAGRQMGWW